MIRRIMQGSSFVNRCILGIASLLITSSPLLAEAKKAEASPGEKPEIVSVKKIWDQAPYNSFTDLIRFKDKWFCTFREGEHHVYGENGKLRVLVSADGEKWESAALLAEEGIDLRDSKLSITPDNRLMMVAGGSVYEGRKFIERQSRVTFSKDGREWTPIHRVLGKGEWLWRVTWHKNRCYGVSYEVPADRENEWTLRLYGSDDGVKYDLITLMDVADHPGEVTVRFLPDDQMVALIRREGGDKSGVIGTSQAPYKKWQWHTTPHRLGGPNFIVLPDGQMWATSRSHEPGSAKTVLARMTTKTYEPVLTLPSGGDCSYPGLVWHEGLLWISYYASHEGKASIYLAKIKLPDQEHTEHK